MFPIMGEKFKKTELLVKLFSEPSLQIPFSESADVFRLSDLENGFDVIGHHESSLKNHDFISWSIEIHLCMV